MEVDWAPVNLYIYVSDNEGNDLLDPDGTEFIAGMLSVEFKGSSYMRKPSSKAYLAILDGFELKQDAHGVWFVQFGEIDGAAEYDDDIIVRWSDEDKDIIHYTCDSHNERKLSCRRSWKLNGKPCSNPVRIIK